MEMLWTDPQVEAGRGPSKRGVGMMFGPDVTARFCERNGLDAIIRSHEVRMGGYEVEHGGKCITGKILPKITRIQSIELLIRYIQCSLHQITSIHQGTRVHTSMLGQIISFSTTCLMLYHILRSSLWLMPPVLSCQ